MNGWVSTAAREESWTKSNKYFLVFLVCLFAISQGETEELDTCLRWEITRKVTVYHRNISKAVGETGTDVDYVKRNVIEVSCLPLNVVVHAFERVFDFP